MFKTALLKSTALLLVGQAEHDLKLSTISSIRYLVDIEEPFSRSTSKTPWITVNGINVSDSQLAVEFLTKELQKVGVTVLVIM